MLDKGLKGDEPSQTKGWKISAIADVGLLRLRSPFPQLSTGKKNGGGGGDSLTLCFMKLSFVLASLLEPAGYPLPSVISRPT